MLIYFWGDENILELEVVVVQPCQCAKYDWMVHLTMINFLMSISPQLKNVFEKRKNKTSYFCYKTVQCKSFPSYHSLSSFISWEVVRNAKISGPSTDQSNRSDFEKTPSEPRASNHLRNSAQWHCCRNWHVSHITLQYHFFQIFQYVTLFSYWR